ncbi:hypothetical protein DR88_5051 [Klebsiella pneumoniae]|nr:hypothetical protein DR88_5051 [Klebsiella pneumoniae]
MQYGFPRPRSLRPAAVKAVSAFAEDSPGSVRAHHGTVSTLLRPTGLILRGFSLARRPRQWSGGYSHTRADAAAGRSPQAPYSAPRRSGQGTSHQLNTVPPWGPVPPGSSSRAPTSRRKVHNYLKTHIFFPGIFRFLSETTEFPF